MVRVYRDQYIIERGNSLLKGQPLSLSPFYLQREDHIVGMARLLSIALKALTLFEFLFRQSLMAAQEPLLEIYSGNPKRATRSPSAKLVLDAFQYISKGIISSVYSAVTCLNDLQVSVLILLDFPESIYTGLNIILQT